MSISNLESEETKLASYFTCEICIEPVLSTQMFLHKDNVAHNFCVMSYPGYKCDKTLDPVLECQPLITNDIFVKLCDRLCESVISASSTKYYCPYKQCSEVFIDECDGRMKRCMCPSCKRLFCSKCKTAWPAGHRCSDGDKKNDSNEKKFMVLVEKMKWTRCPGCGQPIDRISGCQHVYCRCGTLFDHGDFAAYHPGRRYLFRRDKALYIFFFFGSLGMIALVFIVVFLLEKSSTK